MGKRQLRQCPCFIRITWQCKTTNILHEMDTPGDHSTCVIKTNKQKTKLDFGKKKFRLMSKVHALYSYISSSTRRMFLFSASMAFISSSVREKSKIWRRKSLMLDINFTVYMWLPNMHPQRPKAVLHLEIVLDPFKVKTLGDHNDSSLNIKAQSHLGTALVVLSPNRYQDLLLQQGRTL